MSWLRFSVAAVLLAAIGVVIALSINGYVSDALAAIIASILIALTFIFTYLSKRFVR